MGFKALIRRVIISAIRDSAGETKRVDATGLPDEAFLDREQFQHFGFTSWPKASCEGIFIGIGNVLYMIAEDDRVSRITGGQPGESALYNADGTKVHLKMGLVAEISGAAQINLGDALQANLKKLIDERFKTLYDAHTHQVIGVQGGFGTIITTTPAVQLDLAANATSITRAK